MRSATELLDKSDLYCLPCGYRGEEHADPAWRDICYTASVRRMHHDYRLAVVSHSSQDAYDKLATFLNDGTSRELMSGRRIADKRQKVAWIFPGQGSQWAGMGRDLLEQE